MSSTDDPFAKSSELQQRRGIRVPSGRLSRAARIGSMSTGILGAMAAGGTRALLSGERPKARDLLLTPANARRLADELARMRGAAMKMGQLLSMEASDILPPELAEVLSRLRADADHMPPRQLKQVLIGEYGPDFLRRFNKFDVRPIAAASIGQVHRVETHDGRRLALKIQYPGVRQSIDADVANLGALLRASRLLPAEVALDPLLDEARRQLHEEADYIREADHLRHFADLIGEDPHFVVPAVHSDFCTGNILAMDFVQSAPIETVEAADQATRDAVATRLFSLFANELLDWRVIQTDPNFANYRWQSDRGRIVLLDFGAARPFPMAFSNRMRDVLALGQSGQGDAVMQQLVQADVLPADLPDGQRCIIDEMMALSLPMLSADRIDFGDTRLLASLRDLGMRLGSDEGFRHIPPWDVLYMQRKLGGLVLLATRLRARVPLSEILKERLTTA
ncbi:ABC1 kinase family protein [Thalassococcus lentus]|uniref:AarF/ABC1/UbiB kinase family protein n=1 Tax=Thalassococcus lentus TaxID=1210524 RepID=A0ABT4XQ70_9RHOB|nr:AarF/ABC1/UbiB kinase family protein [Thalassococcus lentus]MDA7424102.1 AarF/ABC1/UbiB kinase family protein [Thalassococcus lentus]